MSESKSALIVANYRYEHADLRQLVAPAQDAESLAGVLADPLIGGFEVHTLVNEPSQKVSLEIESFCDNRKRDDLLLLYFSGHGIRDFDDGQLYFATVDTQLVRYSVRRATAVSAQFVNQAMSRSRSRRQILVLDCCYSGAFKEGMLAKGDQRVGAGEQLEGEGRVVLTASDALQYSFENEQVKGEGVRSVFTRALVRGLETGEADLDHDGSYALDEVYDYVYARVTERRPEQKPMKMGYVEGKIFIGSNPRPVPAPLPQELQDSLEDHRPWVRLGVAQELGKLLGAGNKGLALAAQAALALLAKQDDSQKVRAAAEECLSGHKQEAIAPAESKVVAHGQTTLKPDSLPAAPDQARDHSSAGQEYRAQVVLAAGAQTKQLASQDQTHEGKVETRVEIRPQVPQRPHQAEVLEQTPSASRPAEWVRPMRRIGADLIDGLIVYVFLLIGSAGLFSVGLRVGAPKLVLVIAPALAFCIHRFGRTLGHQLMGTRIVDSQGNPPTYLRSVGYISAWFAWYWLLPWCMWALFFSVLSKTLR